MEKVHSLSRKMILLTFHWLNVYLRNVCVFLFHFYSLLPRISHSPCSIIQLELIIENACTVECVSSHWKLWNIFYMFLNGSRLFPDMFKACWTWRRKNHGKSVCDDQTYGKSFLLDSVVSYSANSFSILFNKRL